MKNPSQALTVISHDAAFWTEFDWMRVEIDFEYMSDAGLSNGDVKTISPFAAAEWGEQETDEIPLYYCLQFDWGMMVTGRPTVVKKV